MNILGVSQLISDYFAGLPEMQRMIVYKALYVLGILSVLLLVWRLSNSERRLESGKIETKWHHPRNWYERYKKLKAENYKQAPEGAVAFVEWSNKVFAKVYAAFGFLFGGLLVATFVWLDFEFVWIGVTGMVIMILAYFINTKPDDEVGSD